MSASDTQALHSSTQASSSSPSSFSSSSSSSTSSSVSTASNTLHTIPVPAAAASSPLTSYSLGLSLPSLSTLSTRISQASEFAVSVSESISTFVQNAVDEADQMANQIVQQKGDKVIEHPLTPGAVLNNNGAASSIKSPTFAQLYASPLTLPDPTLPSSFSFSTRVRYASSNIAEDELPYALSLTPAVLEWADALSEHDSTFQDFPIPQTEEEKAGRRHWEMSVPEECHARLILKKCSNFAKLRYRLCPKVVKESAFWRIYFILLANIKKKHALIEAAVSSPQAANQKRKTAAPLSSLVRKGNEGGIDYDEVERLCGISRHVPGSVDEQKQPDSGLFPANEEEDENDRLAATSFETPLKAERAPTDFNTPDTEPPIPRLKSPLLSSNGSSSNRKPSSGTYGNLLSVKSSKKESGGHGRDGKSKTSMSLADFSADLDEFVDLQDNENDAPLDDSTLDQLAKELELGTVTSPSAKPEASLSSSAIANPFILTAAATSSHPSSKISVVSPPTHATNGSAISFDDMNDLP